MIIDRNYEFCQTCIFRGDLIPGTESFCPRTVHDNISAIAGSLPEDVRNELDSGSDTSITERQFSFDVEMMDAIVDCVESIKRGGSPIAVE